MPPLVPIVDDCRATHAQLRARGVEFTQEPIDRYGTVVRVSAIRRAMAGR